MHESMNTIRVEKSLKGLNMNNPGFQPRVKNANDALRPRRNRIEKQQQLRTEWNKTTI